MYNISKGRVELLRLLGSDLQDTILVSDSLLNWLRVTRRNLTDASKKLLWYSYILCDKYEHCDNIPIDAGEIASIEGGYRITIAPCEFNYLMKTSGVIENNSLDIITKGKNRTREEIQKIVTELGSMAVLEVTDEHFKAIAFARTVEYIKETGNFYIDVNREFILAMREAVKFSQVYGRLQSATSYILTNGELLLYSWIVMNEKAIETQKILGNVDYQGVSFAELCSRLGLNGRPVDNKKVIDRCLCGINSKLGLHIKVFPYYKGRRLVRIRFYCEEGGVHVGKYFGEKKTNNGRPTNILVNLYKIKYENYYGCKLSEREESKLHFAIVDFFKSHSLDFKKEEDKDWFIDNVLDVLFERYDKLGYSSVDFPRFCANNLKTWVIDNIINDIPNKKKEDKNDLTGKVGTVAMEHQDWMDIDVSDVDDEEVF
jgi:hypothetical protein